MPRTTALLCALGAALVAPACRRSPPAPTPTPTQEKPVSDTRQPLALETAESSSRFVQSRAQVLFFRSAPDPSARRGLMMHVMTATLDGGGRRQLTPHDVLWSQVSPDGARLASASFERRLVVTEIASGAERVVVEDLAPARAPKLKSDVPPLFQWSPDGEQLLVQTEEDDADGDGYADRSTFRLYRVADGRLVHAFHRRSYAPYLWHRSGRSVVFPGDSGGQVVVLDVPGPGERRARLVLDENAPAAPDVVRPDDLHFNLTPSLVLHDTSISPRDGTTFAVRGNKAFLVGPAPGAERQVVTAETALYSPCWTEDGRYVVFYARTVLYVYDAQDHRLGALGPGAPSPLALRAGYRPPRRRLTPPHDLFELSERTY